MISPCFARIEGRCGEAVYPLLHSAHKTGNQRYLDAAVAVMQWSENNIYFPDGSTVNDVSVSDWRGITVHSAVCLGESILRYKTILEPEIYVRWYHRLQRQADYLYKTITIDFANINYPACCAYAMALHWEMLKGLSGHGDYTELTEWLKHSNLRPHTPISLIHGEPDAADSFRLYLKDHTQFDVAVGEYRNVLTI